MSAMMARFLTIYDGYKDSSYVGDDGDDGSRKSELDVNKMFDYLINNKKTYGNCNIIYIIKLFYGRTLPPLRG